MRVLFVLNDPPYGTERTYNGLRLATALAKRPDVQVRVFLMGDAAVSAKRGQRTPQGYYNLERMILALGQNGGELAVCGSCMDARALSDSDLVPPVARGTLEQLADWTLWADRSLVF